MYVSRYTVLHSFFSRCLVNLIARGASFLIRDSDKKYRNWVKYFVYVLLDNSKVELKSIIRHTCSYNIDMQMADYCYHVATISCFFSFVRQPPTNTPVSFLNDYFILKNFYIYKCLLHITFPSHFD